MQQSQDLNEGWIILILLGSLAVSVSTVSFGLGFVNLVAGEMAPPPPPSEQAPGSLGKGTPLPSDEAALRRQVERVRAQLSRMRDDERALADEVAEKTRLTAGVDAPPAVAATVAESDAQRLRQAREEIAELEQQTRNLRKQIVDRKSVDASSLLAAATPRVSRAGWNVSPTLSSCIRKGLGCRWARSRTSPVRSPMCCVPVTS